MKKHLCILILSITVGSIFLFSFVNADDSDLVISEICPTGCAGSGNQWIEIFNKGILPINVEGWKFWEDGTNHGLTVGGQSKQTDWLVEPNEYAVIAQNDANFALDYPEINSTIFDSSWSTLNKSGEEIGLKKSSAEADFLEKFTYAGISGFSLQRINFDNPAEDPANWCENPSGNSVGKENICPSTPPPDTNQPPTAVIITNSTILTNEETLFDGSTSSDPESDTLIYQWLLEEELISTNSVVTYTFSATGSYYLSLLVTDTAGATSTASTIINVTEDEPETTTTSIKILINEFVAIPAENEHEWIELYNPTTSTVDLTGWTLSDGVGVISSPTNTISELDYQLITLSSAKLNNSGGDIITLKNPAGEIVDTVSYGNWDDGIPSDNTPLPDETNAIARTIDGEDSDNDQVNFAETTTPTPGDTNQITAPPIPPPTSSSGGGGSSGQTVNNNSENLTTTTTIAVSNITSIIITEIFPNPKGSDNQNEFIELKNISNQPVDLSNWRLGDSSTRRFTIKNKTIAPNEYLIFKRTETGIAINNTGDEEIILLDSSGAVVEKINWNESAEEDQSYIRLDDNTWVWTSYPTPGGKNIVKEKNLPPVVSLDRIGSLITEESIVFDASDTFDPENDVLNFIWNFGDGDQAQGELVDHVFDKADKYKILLTVTDSAGNKTEKRSTITIKTRPDEIIESVVKKTATKTTTAKTTVKKTSTIKSLKVISADLLGTVQSTSSAGDQLLVSGVVAVTPGIFGTQYFYLSGNGGLQIYQYAKKFPALKIGDRVQIKGEISEVNGEKRLKVKEQNDIKIISSGESPIAKSIETTEIDETYIGQLIKIKGEITELKSTYLYLDDGTDEAKVYFKSGTGIKNTNWTVGDTAEITGIVQPNKGGFQILPRSLDDIIKIKSVADSNTLVTLSNQSIDAPKSLAETYLTATAGGLTSILIGLGIKLRGSFLVGIIRKSSSVILAGITKKKY